MKLKLKVYISGALTHGDNIQALKAFYEKIGEVCGDLGLDVYIPHEHTDPLDNPDVSCVDVYRIDMREISKADLVVAYVGIPSLGVGAEVERAYHAGTDVVLLYEKGAKVSRLIRGNPVVLDSIVFGSREELHEMLQSFLGKWKMSVSKEVK